MHWAVLFSVLITLCILGCSSQNQQQAEVPVTDSTNAIQPLAQKISGAVADSLLEKLCRRWYSKKLTLHDAGEEYPTNNEELTLLRDMNYTAVDRVEEDSLGGTWQIVDIRTIQLTDQSGESHRFELLHLSDTALITKVLDATDENISIAYSAFQ